MNLDYYNDIPNVNVTPEMRNRYYSQRSSSYVSNEEDCGRPINGIKIIKNNCKKNVVEEFNNSNSIKIHCNECDSELEITEKDTHIGWLGAKYITCPCCGEESMVDELYGITLTKDNLEFPVHFNRTAKGLRHIVEVNSDAIIKEIQRAITYFRENKDEFCWYTSHGDLFLIVFRYSGDEEYFVMVTKDFYETYIPFENEDYDKNDNKNTRLRDAVNRLEDTVNGLGNMI